MYIHLSLSLCHLCSEPGVGVKKHSQCGGQPRVGVEGGDEGGVEDLRVDGGGGGDVRVREGGVERTCAKQEDKQAPRDKGYPSIVYYPA